MWSAISLVVAAIVIGVSVYGASQLSDQKSSAKACPANGGINHSVVINSGRAVPAHTSASRCDTLTITNLDGTNRLMAFGNHDHHMAYDGTIEKLLGKGQSLEVQLVQTGDFHFHDHLHDEVQGTFSVR